MGLSLIRTAVLIGLLLAGTIGGQSQRYRSKITIFDLARRSTRILYQADEVIEAPNWSRDGKFLLVNTGGSLYRLNVAGEARLEKIYLGDKGLRCNNDHDFSRDGKLLAFSASNSSSRQSQVYVARADGTSAKLMTPASPAIFMDGRPMENGWHSSEAGVENLSFIEYP